MYIRRCTFRACRILIIKLALNIIFWILDSTQYAFDISLTLNLHIGFFVISLALGTNRLIGIISLTVSIFAVGVVKDHAFFVKIWAEELFVNNVIRFAPTAIKIFIIEFTIGVILIVG